MARILIYGGSFDPIHNGHINIAKEIMLALNIDRVIFEPALAPRWKTPNVEAKHRLEMLKIAISKYPCFEYDLFEFNSHSEENYSIDTIRYFKNKYPNDELYFLIGYDQLDKLDKWYKIDELSKLTRIVAYNRSGYDKNQGNIEKYHVLLVEGPQFDVSSTEVRELKSIDVDEDVLHYILMNKLYFASKLANRISDKRYYHSVEVAMLALKVANNNSIDPLKAFQAALLHDIGKEVEQDETLNIMNAELIDYKNIPKFSYHQFVGAYLAKTLFKIEDKEVVDAIKFHATGNSDMTPIGMIVYASDKIEPTRGFDSSKLIESLVNDYYSGFITVLAENKKFLLNKNASIDNPLTTACMNQYLKY